MRTLASVLEAAISRGATEITLESEQPVIYRTARGSEMSAKGSQICGRP